ncbi:MAG: cell division protein SepF [Clostridiales bacterium]|nr:cell division protein SepF [Clostridiales bacterium]
MSVLKRVTGWLTGKSANNAQAAYGGYRPRGYYGSPEAEDAYGSMVSGRSFDAHEENLQHDYNPPADRFSGSAEDPYNGRVPYRSRQDMYREEYRRSAQQDMQYRHTEPQQGYQPEQPQYRQQGNVVDFPGRQEAAPAHVEYVILLRSRNECTKVIEYIKTNASVFLNMEYIANESERQRCVDMLSGAAYTLGCQLHKISNRGIYLIASPYVRVMIDPAMKRFNASSESQPFMQQQTGEYPPVSEPEWNPQPAQAQPFAEQTYEAPAQPAAPYSQQQQAYSPFQRPRPTLRSQQQQPEPFRRASGGQYFNRQPSANPSSFQ